MMVTVLEDALMLCSHHDALGESCKMLFAMHVG
jgi:hypothetical protein